MGPIDDIAFQAAAKPHAPAAHDLRSGRQWSYRDLDQAIGRCASVLRMRYGCGPGDRVASLAKNRVELIILHFACARAALIYVPLNWRLSAPEVATLLADAEPHLLLGDDELKRLGLTGLDLDAFCQEIDVWPTFFIEPPDPERISLILFTSGTSGRPKGVMLSERALRETAVNFGLLGCVDVSSVMLIDSPMFHIIGLVTSVRPVFLHGGLLLVSDRFDPEQTLKRLSDTDLAVTHYFCVPQMADRMRAAPNFDGSALKQMTAIFTGGAPHPPASIAAWLDAGVPVVDGFGMSEAGTVLGMSLRPDIIRAKAGFAGLPPPGVGVRIVDDLGREVEPGCPGELLLKGRNLFEGYWRRPEETAKAFTDDGWFRTGDVALCDADGYLAIVDRRKDMFISGGENVYPAEIEAQLVDFPGLVEAAVVGVRDERWGEVGLCVLVARGDAEAIIASVRKHLSARLAGYKQPRRFLVVDALPRTGSGKVIKAALKDLAPS